MAIPLNREFFPPLPEGWCWDMQSKCVARGYGTEVEVFLARDGRISIGIVAGFDPGDAPIEVIEAVIKRWRMLEGSSS